jgi:hypothetical protein
MANYEIDPYILRPFCQKGVESLDLSDGKAYISLVGFMFKDTKLFNIKIPYFGNFEEILICAFGVVEKRKYRSNAALSLSMKRFCILLWFDGIINYITNITLWCLQNTKLVMKAQAKVNFEWLPKIKWNSIYVEVVLESIPMKSESLEQFIYEHYYGYTKNR